MRIQHNITAMNSYRNFSNNTSKLNKNLEKLASGYKINRAGDDAAGLAISEKMRAQISGLEGATKNAKDGISLIQTAEGALTEVHDMLNRMVTLAEQSANGTYQDELDRDQLQKEITNLKDEIDRVADSTNYNGIQLLNGDLDYAKETTVTADSAISNISSTDYSAKGANNVFSIDEKSVVVRPAANPNQTCASFQVNLNAAAFSGIEAGDTLTLSVKGTDISIKAFADNDATANDKLELTQLGTSSGLATAFALAGKTGTGLTVTANNNNAAGDSTTAWLSAVNGQAANASATGVLTEGDATAGTYVNIDGHSWKMTASGEVLTFTQVDKMETGTADLNPDYPVALSVTESATPGTLTPKVTQQPNDQVQVTSTGKSIGSSQQAEVDINIDFSSLRDGDRLVAGDKTYVFAIGSDSQYTAAKYPSAQMANGEVRVDLHDIFEETADLSDSSKQALAMAKMVKDMGTADTADTNTTTTGVSTAWTIGNGGVNGGIGTLSFQSKKEYNEDDIDGGDASTNAKIIGTGTMYTGAAGQDQTTVARMDTASNIVKQFQGTSTEKAATTSFDIDVTKIKAGDTFTLDGKTFEFTDGATSSVEGGIAVDLSSYGVANGLLAGQRADVLSTMKNAMDSALQVTDSTGQKIAKYSFSSSGDTITLTSNDDASTNTFENRVSADLCTPSTTTYGKGLVLQIGDTSDDYNTMSVSVADMHASALGIGDVDISTQDGASAALDSIKAAVNKVSDTRGNLGAMQNRLEHTINNLGVMRENVQNAESLIRDTDVAEEMMAYTKNNILNQSAQAMLAQANQLPQGVLQLLG